MDFDFLLLAWLRVGHVFFCFFRRVFSGGSSVSGFFTFCGLSFLILVAPVVVRFGSVVVEVVDEVVVDADVGIVDDGTVDSVL